MLQQSTEGQTGGLGEGHALLTAVSGLAIECFARLFAAAIAHIAATGGAVRQTELGGAVSIPADLSASAWAGGEGSRLIAEFRAELHAQAQAFCELPQNLPVTPSPALTLASLEQIGYDETESLVTLRSLAQWIETLSQEEFYLFNHRFGYLCGQFALPPSRNPFGPTRMLESFDRAARRVAGYPDVRLSLLRLFRRGGFEAAVFVYATLNQFLLDFGVLPRFRPRLRRDVHEQDARMRAIGPLTEEVERFRRELADLAHAAHRSLDPESGVGEADLVEQAPATESPQLSPMLPAQPAGGRVVAMPHVDWRDIAAGARLKPARARQRTDVSVLETIRASAVARRIGRIGSVTLHITNQAFDRLLVTHQLATPVRLLLARLQLAFYKAALTDTTVMSRRPHPVRSLVNRLTEAGVAWSPELGEQDTLFQAMATIVERLQRPAKDEVDAFAGELEQFERFIDTETQVARQAAAARARHLYLDERNRIAYATAATELDRTLHDEIYPPLPDFAERFVRDNWVHTLREAYLRGGRESEQWRANLDFLHELTWSLKPKPTESERRILLRSLPGLISRIRATLARAQGDPATAEFLRALMHTHLQLVRTGALPRHLQDGSRRASPRERVEYLALLAKLDPELARRAQPPVVHVGTWVEFGSGAAARYRKKLVWVSPLSHRALFTNRRGEGEVVLNPAEVQDKLGCGHLTPLQTRALFETSLREAKLELGRPVAPR
jgi:hypothetical protein